MEPLSSYSVSIQLCCFSSSVASRLPSRTGPDGKTTLGPHTSDLWCLGGSSLGDSPRTLHGVVSPSGLLVLNQTPLVLVSIRVSLQVLVCGWLAASPCPLPPLPPFRQVSWLLTIPTVAPYHLSDIHCPGREQGAPRPAFGTLPGPLCWPWRPISFLFSTGGPAWFLGDPGPRETPSHTFTFALQLALLKSFHVF